VTVNVVEVMTGTAGRPSPPVRQGSALTVTGTITRAGRPFTTGRSLCSTHPDATTWTTIADGTLTATVQPARTGSYRYHYGGDHTTAPGTSPAQQVTVNPEITRSASPPARR
jgi:hypothetical protein